MFTMMRKVPPLSPEARAFLEREREVPQLSPAARARSLARARAAAFATGHIGRDVGRAFPSSRPSRLRWAAAAAVLGVASAAAAASAYRLRDRWAAVPKPMAASAAPGPVSVAPASRARRERFAKEALEEAPAVLPAAEPASPVLHRAGRAGAGEDELRLLRRARAAVAEGDFEGALRPIAEHARRFPDGTLTEEREALRVRSLSALGQVEEARRAAGSFRKRFPASVLVHVLETSPTRE